MPNYRPLFFSIGFLVVAVILVFIGKYRSVIEPIIQKPVLSETKQYQPAVPSAETEIAVYEQTYTTGFEEDMLNVHYELKYTPAFITIDSLGPTIYIREKNNTVTHSLTIFYNGAAGFSSTQHFWEEMHFCPECQRINPTIDVGESKDLIMFTDGQKEWAVFERLPGFVVAEYYIGSGRVKEVISSLNMDVTPGTAIL